MRLGVDMCGGGREGEGEGKGRGGTHGSTATQL